MAVVDVAQMKAAFANSQERDDVKSWYSKNVS